MAVTAYWLELTVLQGGQRKVNLRTDLIGFMHVPGSSGDRLADVFYFIINRVGLEKSDVFFNHRSLANFFQIGWVTTDDTSNNFTMLTHLKDLIKSSDPNTQFLADSHHIR